MNSRLLEIWGKKTGRRCQTPQVWLIYEGQTVRSSVCLCLHTCSYKCCYCLCGWNLFCCVYPCVVASWVVLPCVYYGKRQREGMQCVVYVCVGWCLGFDGGVEPPRANGDTAVVHPKHLSGILTVDYEERWKRIEKEQRRKTPSEAAGKIFLASSAILWKKKKTLALCLLHVESVVFAPLSVPDHYHVPLTRFRMKLRNSGPGCDI